MIYVILGQTASGKTSLALKLAKELNIPIISADAYQCYKYMQIGTDKPSLDMVKDVSYHFFDEYDLNQNMSVFQFQKEGRKLIEKYNALGKDIIVTGGTFLYIKALLFNYKFNKENNTDNYDLFSLDELKSLLKEKSIETYNLIDNNNPRRVIRALRQIDNGFDPKELNSSNNEKTIYPCTFFQIDVDINSGNTLIDKRVDEMFLNGFVDEVKNIISKYDMNLPSLKAIGYPEVISYLNNEIDLNQAKELIKTHTHQLAKKQRTFLRHQFLNVYLKSKEEIYSLIYNDVKLKERSRILLKEKVNLLESKNVLLAGLGGVGGTVLLSLIRLGVKNITIVDKDIVDPTNLNRQFLYNYYDIGKDKASVAKSKALEISPICNINIKSIFITSKDDFKDEKYDYVIDCIDDLKAKAQLYLKAKEDHGKLITSMGFGFHLNSTKIKIGKLKETNGHMVSIYKDELKKLNVCDEEIDDIDTVFPTDARIKNVMNSKTIGSIVTCPNGAGLAIISLFVMLNLGG